MQYIIVEADTKHDLEENVRNWIKLGFEPVGSVSVSQFYAGAPRYSELIWNYAQALVKKEE